MINKRVVHLFFSGWLLVGWGFQNLRADDAAPVARPPHSSRLKKKLAKKDTVTPAQQKSTVNLDTAVANTPKKYGANFDAWLKKMKRRVTTAQTQRNRLIAVAAVRGDEVKEAPPLYWKGKKSDGPLKEEELASFNEAIETALKGEQVQAKAKLEKFVSAYPNSPLIGEAQDTLKMMPATEGSPVTEAGSGN